MTTAPLDRIGRAVTLAALALFAVVPLLSLLSTALSPIGTVPQGLTWPSDPQWGNFVEAWNAANFLTLLGSSTLIVLGVVPVALLLATLAGYALATFRVPGGRFVWVLFLLGLTLPIESLITPLYNNIRDLGLLGTRWAVIIPQIALLMPFGVFWMRTQFSGMEPALTESRARRRRQSLAGLHAHPSAVGDARVVGARDPVLPGHVEPVPAALVLIDDPSQRTMAGGLGAFQGQYGDNIQLLCAGSPHHHRPRVDRLPRVPAQLCSGSARRRRQVTQRPV